MQYKKLILKLSEEGDSQATLMLFSWKCIIQDRDDRVSGNSQLNLA
jgi:hypothetical protein